MATFNIKFAREIDSAISVFRAEPELANLDLITLQEMDALGTKRIADALGMHYVYYPAAIHPIGKRDYGTAILSRWPIVADQRITLPHRDRFEHMQRTVTAATIAVGSTPVRVYSLHLSTWVNAGPKAKRAEVQAVLDDAASHPVVIVAGDMNGRGIGNHLAANGYTWLTRNNPHTNHIWNWDHVFLKGFAERDSVATGVVRDNHHASDHRAVWAVAELPGIRS